VLVEWITRGRVLFTTTRGMSSDRSVRLRVIHREGDVLADCVPAGHSARRAVRPRDGQLAGGMVAGQGAVVFQVGGAEIDTPTVTTALGSKLLLPVTVSGRSGWPQRRAIRRYVLLHDRRSHQSHAEEAQWRRSGPPPGFRV